jgi:hypothetical protein
MKGLNKKIEELKERDKLDKQVARKMRGIAPVSAFPFGYKAKGTDVSLTVNLTKVPLNQVARKIADTLNVYKPTCNNLLMFAGKDDQPTASPFVLRFDNPCTNIGHCTIDYISGKNWIHIDVPLSFYSDDVKGVYMRKVYDSEYHYFTGVSMERLHKLQLRAHCLDMFEVVKYWGGDAANYVTDPADAEEFAHVVTKGHTKEFADFWAKQLEEQAKG